MFYLKNTNLMFPVYTKCSATFEYNGLLISKFHSLVTCNHRNPCFADTMQPRFLFTCTETFEKINKVMLENII